ncbi:MAG: hypothetical protein CVU52_06055, partial [Deltaproteobacteria bacterium HGW-Deltaproteobacteria-10]
SPPKAILSTFIVKRSLTCTAFTSIIHGKANTISQAESSTPVAFFFTTIHILVNQTSKSQ